MGEPIQVLSEREERERGGQREDGREGKTRRVDLFERRKIKRGSRREREEKERRVEKIRTVPVTLGRRSLLSMVESTSLSLLGEGNEIGELVLSLDETPVVVSPELSSSSETGLNCTKGRKSRMFSHQSASLPSERGEETREREEKRGNEPSSTMKKAECLWVRAMRDLKNAGEACLSPPAKSKPKKDADQLSSTREKRNGRRGRERTLAENRLDDHSCDGRLDLPVSREVHRETRRSG